jgi:hypothetical protein
MQSNHGRFRDRLALVELQDCLAAAILPDFGQIAGFAIPFQFAFLVEILLPERVLFVWAEKWESDFLENERA